MHPFVVIMSASRYNRSASSLVDAARRYAAGGADLLLWTEIERRDRSGALAAGLPGYGLSKGRNGNADDCGISYRQDRFSVIHEESRQVTSIRIPRRGGGGLRDPLHARFAVLYDKVAGRRLAVAVVHLPSAVNTDLGKRPPRWWSTASIAKIRTRWRRPAQWVAAYRGTKRHLNRIARVYRVRGRHGRILAADLNLNLNVAWARQLVKRIAPRYQLAWKPPFPKLPGTLGKRLIDALLYRGGLDTDGSRLIADDPSSEHRPFRTLFHWKPTTTKGAAA